MCLSRGAASPHGCPVHARLHAGVTAVTQVPAVLVLLQCGPLHSGCRAHLWHAGRGEERCAIRQGCSVLHVQHAIRAGHIAGAVVTCCGSGFTVTLAHAPC